MKTPNVVTGGNQQNTVKFVIRFITDHGNVLEFYARFFSDGIASFEKNVVTQKRVWEQGSITLKDVNHKMFNGFPWLMQGISDLVSDQFVTLLSGTVHLLANSTHGIRETTPRPFTNAFNMLSTLVCVGCDAGIKWLPTDAAGYVDHTLTHSNATALQRIAKQAAA